MEKDTETRIIEAALEEFAEKGKEGARMQAIADRAGVNKALLHYYFRKKEDLYHSVLRSFFEKVFANIEEIPLNPTAPEEMLKSLIDAYMGMLRQNPKVPRIMLRQLLDRESTEEIFQEIFKERLLGQSRQTLLTIIKTLQEKGIMRDVEPSAALLAFLGSMIFFFIGMPIFKIVFPETDPASDRFFGTYKNTVATLFSHGLFTEGKLS